MSMEKVFRTVFLALLLAVAMFLLGSTKVEVQKKPLPSEAELFAQELGRALPRADQSSWKKNAAANPMWLIRVSSY